MLSKQFQRGSTAPSRFSWPFGEFGTRLNPPAKTKQPIGSPLTSLILHETPWNVIEASRNSLGVSGELQGVSRLFRGFYEGFLDDFFLDSEKLQGAFKEVSGGFQKSFRSLETVSADFTREWFPKVT